MKKTFLYAAAMATVFSLSAPAMSSVVDEPVAASEQKQASSTFCERATDYGRKFYVSASDYAGQLSESASDYVGQLSESVRNNVSDYGSRFYNTSSAYAKSFNEYAKSFSEQAVESAKEGYNWMVPPLNRMFSEFAMLTGFSIPAFKPFTMDQGNETPSPEEKTQSPEEKTKSKKLSVTPVNQKKALVEKTEKTTASKTKSRKTKRAEARAKRKAAQIRYNPRVSVR